LLFDQKMNNGIPVPFFGIEAMTAMAPAQLALRFGCPLMAVRTERTGPGRFRITAQGPLTPPETGDRQEDAARLTAELNRILEGWIRAKPEDWLWLHRRWPDAAYTKERESGD
jgi:KDO2-lipid IV(A) lauroyltransferase